MKYFDLHCDTLTKLYDNLLTFDNDLTAVNRHETIAFEPYRQVFAVWSDPKYDAWQNWKRFLDISENIDRFDIPKRGSILAVEGGDILNGEPQRLDEMYARGVRILTFMWKGQTVMGGAWDTDVGLDRFGVAALRHCYHLDIIPDMSHASDKAFFDSLPYAERSSKPLIASHSDSRAVCDHRRNLTDDQFKIIRDLGGIVGISLCPEHLSEQEATIDDIFRHIEHYILMDGEDTVAFGCDFDGIEKTPRGISSVASMAEIAYQMDKRGYGKALSEKILYSNAASFFDKHIVPAKGWEMQPAQS